MLWPNDTLGTAVRRLNAQVTGLRRKLTGQVGDRRLIESRPEGYVLSVEADELDALRFLALSHEGREALARGDAETAAEALREALALWRGPVLGGEPTGPAEPAARRLESLRATATATQLEAEQAVTRESDLATEVAALARIALSAPPPPEAAPELPPAEPSCDGGLARPGPQEAADRPGRRGRFVLPLAAVLLTIAVIGVAAFLLLRDDEGTVAAPSPPTVAPDHRGAEHGRRARPVERQGACILRRGRRPRAASLSPATTSGC